MTIAEAAAEALRRRGGPSTIHELLDRIHRDNLFVFDSPDEVAILREQIRRHCDLPDKTLQYEPVLFRMNSDGRFTLFDCSSESRDLSYRRIRRARDKEALLERLTKKSETRIGDIWQVMLFAFGLGFSRGERLSVDDYDAGKSIDFSYFSGCPAWPGIIHLLGLVEQQDPRILNPEQETLELRIQLFEEYANAGLSIMMGEMESLDFSLDSLVRLIPASTEKTGAPTQI